MLEGGVEKGVLFGFDLHAKAESIIIDQLFRVTEFLFVLLPGLLVESLTAIFTVTFYQRLDEVSSLYLIRQEDKDLALCKALIFHRLLKQII